MLAVLINCIAVTAGSCLGLLMGKRLTDSFKTIVFSCCGLITIVIGIQMAIATSNSLYLLIALLLGGGAGYLLRIEDRVLSLGDRLEHMTSSKNSRPSSSAVSTYNFPKGFMTASILFCSGAMAVVGSIQAGTTGDYTTILIKSVMDGCMAVVFASVYGPGVIFSSLTIFVYQGFFTIAGGWLQPLMGELGINELSAEGGVLLLMIGINMLDIKEFKAGNFIPALVFAPVIAVLADKIF